eukprot:CAMPEP_0202510182 /NCGR_PEP_ID=MMETSP1361-20130828/53161_1 /ASSEMBLY_ACC=CAM_ASM_000849 /TAXON_ID=210615 /ORGANISM="Staurosira complex sp., Strain CCMP2646" /LENGTH=400 /DNA_ID=CAMNT_0049144435 /DNA_START=34 /DNA_END=1236 /DNA_ORIENTATION=+
MSSDQSAQEIIKQDIISNLVTPKANACPMGVRLAWHSAGTFDKNDGTGGTNGATMRYELEANDDANAGLGIARDLLIPVEKSHPHVSVSDVWALAGAAAVEKTGGPKVPVGLGRVDQTDGTKCPPNGRLPDASQGAQHLRDVFYRMGFNDQEIVVLSGAHTLGRCHQSRSGFDGPWTSDPLKFDNTYFSNLIDCKWSPRKWDGPLQYQDESGQLMMLPTDLALIQDEKFKPYVELYAKDQEAFFNDFSKAFAKLLSNGCPAAVMKSTTDSAAAAEKNVASRDFREHCMHGSKEHAAAAVSNGANVHATEPNSDRSALHKAAFWGHSHLMEWLLVELKMDPNVQDYAGDTALHDACRFGHDAVVKALLEKGADKSIKNQDGKTAADVAKDYGKTGTAALVA